MPSPRLAAAAALLNCTGLALAAPTVHVLDLLTAQIAEGEVDLGPNLGVVRDAKTQLIDPMPTGLPVTQGMQLNWEKQLDQLPGGGGSERSSGHIHIDSTANHTLDAPATGPWRLATQGSVDTNAQWSVQLGSGEAATAPGSVLGTSIVVLEFSIPQTVVARLSGLLWIPDDVADTRAVVSLKDFSPGTPTPLQIWSSDLGVRSFEVQRLLQPGRYQLESYALSRESGLPCCNITYAGSSGWDVVLEMDSVAAVPEPASLGLWLVGLGLLGFACRRQAHHPGQEG